MDRANNESCKISMHRILSRQGERIFGVGAAKTGTHSLGDMFRARVRSEHEANAGRLIDLHLAREKTGDHHDLREFLWIRDDRLGLKIDVSQVNLYLIDDLEALFSGNLYILTVRHPVEWLRSIVDDSMRRSVGEVWRRFRDYRFATTGGFHRQEKVLEGHDLYPLRGYLTYWRNAFERVINRVPPDRLLIVKTGDLKKAANDIADFCGLNEPSAPEASTHLFANPQRFGLLGQIDPQYLSDTVFDICGDLSGKMFPERPVSAAVAELQKFECEQ